MINPCPCIYSTNQKHTRTGTGPILALIKLEKKKGIRKKITLFEDWNFRPLNQGL